MRSLIFPYRTLSGNVSLRMDPERDIKIGRGTGAIENLDFSFVQSEERIIDLSSSEFSDATLLELPLKVAASSRREIERIGPDLCAVVIAHCGSTLMRQSKVLHRSQYDPTLWTESLKLDLANYNESITIEVTLSAERRGTPDRFVGVSNEWTILLDNSHLVPPHGALEVLWVDFAADDGFGFLRPYRDEPYYVNVVAEPPVVYLNKGMHGLPELFPDNKRLVGAHKALHETMRSGIAKNVWLALFQASLSGIIGGETGEDPQLPEREWQAKVLQMLLPKIYRELDETEQLRQAVLARSDAQLAGELESRVVAVIGRDIVREGKNFRTAIGSIDNV